MAIKGAGGPNGPQIAVSTDVGRCVGETAMAEGLTQVVFDRGGCKFHGRLKALAEATREAGLIF